MDQGVGGSQVDPDIEREEAQKPVQRVVSQEDILLSETKRPL